MADNALAKQVGKKMPERRKTRLEQIADEIQAYGGRVRDDFMAGAERSAQGLGDIVERGDVLTGIPRLALGGTSWLGAPVSAALSPMLGPILQPVGEAVNTYVGQPVEDLTGYPADITNDLAMTGLTLGAVKGLGMTRPYLARAADQVEGMANRAGYTLRKPANVYGSGPTLTPLVDEAGGSTANLKQWHAPTIADAGARIEGPILQRAFESLNATRNPKKLAAELANDAGFSLEERAALQAKIIEGRAAKASKIKTQGFDPLLHAKNTRLMRVQELKRQKYVTTSPMFQHFSKDRQERVLRDAVLGGNAVGEAKLATVEAITRAAKKRGWEVQHTSKGGDGRVSSRYIVVPGKGRVRVSDHYLPETPQRVAMREMGMGGNWVDEIVVDDWRNSSLDDYMKRLESSE